MVAASATTSTPPPESGPAWDIARLYPDQGHWGEGDYLLLNRQTNRLVELADGIVEVLPVAARSHQRIVLAFRDQLRDYAAARHAGEALVAPYPVRIGSGKFRQPDVVFIRTEHADWLGEDFADSADLVMEDVSEDRTRDLVTKRREYADAGIPEYWIVDPKEQRVILLTLSNGDYVVAVDRQASGHVASILLDGFEIDVAALLAAANRPA